jgi:acyl carrier protein
MHRMPEIADEVRSFVIDTFLFGERDGRFSNDDSFLENGLIDSIGILSLVEFVKEKYAISIADDEIVPDNWDSVSRIAAFVQTKLALGEQNRETHADPTAVRKTI